MEIPCISIIPLAFWQDGAHPVLAFTHVNGVSGPDSAVYVSEKHSGRQGRETMEPASTDNRNAPARHKPSDISTIFAIVAIVAIFTIAR